uniref:Uncharacterized protein n=1 Tax=Aegilops tauschii subsp. strangulata TaxID=200361 RepID=A0A453KR33_AEGTS
CVFFSGRSFRSRFVLLCVTDFVRLVAGVFSVLSQETSKFREHMTWRLEQKKEQYFGEHVEDIVDVCTEVLGTFLQHEYCGPGTLLVHPFLDMKGEIKERGLPGAPQAARAAIAWAEKNIDKDWKEWTGDY